ncbi:hypothetical protein [Candidatus Parabeggiatoa sp. HSG14]|uniref:hypothetical protein n=1 Tax=Candidatus Parabeggiatoa sp. HSG14 TaxID=3055593 RepID=UPI0025A87D07|nr:hypothetical protein [Thiotrichales bacterium HSG14]
MSLTADELNTHIENIMRLRSVKNKAVVLCEGDVNEVKNFKKNPSKYGSLEKLPDANFYKACLPKSMKQLSVPTPVFFNCGDRGNVIKAYLRLKELHAENQNDGYLDINKLFAIIDLDIQTAKVDKYQFENTEEIFKNLYNELKINVDETDSHTIFTTGLIHKEAYFLLPHLEPIFDRDYHLYKNEKLDLHKIYSDIIEEITEDKDLEQNFNIACNRIGFSELNYTNINELKESFSEKFTRNLDYKLIGTLFLIRKVKPYWENIHTIESRPKEHLSEKELERLSLKIAEFYSEQDDKDFHLTAIFKSIYRQAYKVV